MQKGRKKVRRVGCAHHRVAKRNTAGQKWWAQPTLQVERKMMMHRTLVGLVLVVCLAGTSQAVEPVARWDLTKSTPDVDAREVRFEDGAATFDGRSSQVIVPAEKLPPLGTLDFSISAWLHTDEFLDDVPGDIISQYDPATRRGFHLSLVNAAGVTSSQAMQRQLQFGIDNGQSEAEWTDHGRLGKAVLIWSLTVHDGQLFASTCVAEPEAAGHVYRFDGREWHDCGTVDKANSVSAMAVYNGELYVASCKYRLRGSALAESENPNNGGKIFKYVAGGKWEPCGELPNTEAVNALIVFKGKLYAGSLYAPAGFFRYEGGMSWTSLETPGKRVESMTVFNGDLYATGYDEGAIYRFNGEKWQHLGVLPEATQTYGFAIHEGSLYVSEWPHAHVFRLGPNDQWQFAGRMGMELESMPLMVYNGKMYGGTLPLAEVYRYDGGETWTRFARLDLTPDVKYRRVWSMAIFQGRLFAGVLPSGHVHSIQIGKQVTYDRPLAAGWQHVAAVREGRQLKLYVNGEAVATSTDFDPKSYDLTSTHPLTIGFGPHDHFNGKLRDVRLYHAALTAVEVHALAKSRP